MRPKATPYICSAALAALIFFLPVCAQQAPPPALEMQGFTETFTMQGKDASEKIRSLLLFGATDTRSITRMWLTTPFDGALVVTQRMDSLEGHGSERLFDARAGWWAELTIDYEVKENTLRNFFDRGYEESGDRERPYRLRTSGGITFEAIVASTTEGFREFASLLTQTGLGQHLAEEMPAHLRNDLQFLDRGIDRDYYSLPETEEPQPLTASWRPLVEILLAVIDPEESGHAQMQRGEPWTVHELERQKGLNLDSAHAREVLRHFSASTPVDPAAEIRRELLKTSP